ncbi:MAG TPA: hypothetical protein VFT37_11030 [Telluria sp.]|nr:hypothetical protein [Telluria sp.]
MPIGRISRLAKTTIPAPIAQARPGMNRPSSAAAPAPASSSMPSPS